MEPLFLTTADPSINNALLQFFVSQPRLTYTILIIICFVLVGLFYTVAQLIKKTLEQMDSVKIGPINLKSKTKLSEQSVSAAVSQSRQHYEIDIDSFIKLLDIIMSVELEKVIHDTVTVTHEIEVIERNYEMRAKGIFEKEFAILKFDFYDGLMYLAKQVTHFDDIMVKKSREYFCVMELKERYEREWMSTVNSIMKRNGFIRFLETSTPNDYIDELEECATRIVAESRDALDLTEFDNSSILELIIKVNRSHRQNMNDMFRKLALLKKNTEDKKTEKLKQIDTMISEGASGIIINLKQKLLDPSEDDIKMLQQMKVEKSYKDKDDD